ncbi:formate--phosphoribosylaminoimidazolecarboxamide ligase [Candidatus Micrarchaeota archaeon]|nr:formate--phosphoribosylaminoimidazolecarboxamide ligase [Candidatus Micrarchaeota archaeon]
MFAKQELDEILSSYKDFKIATICSHSALQIFNGAREQGVKTIGICTERSRELYESFPYAKPDEFIMVDDYTGIPVDELVEKESILIPHGSLVEYVGDKIDDLAIPIFGNRGSLVYEKSRNKMFEWMHRSGLRTPRVLKPDEIDGPSIVKFPGAKGGKGYIVVHTPEEYYSLVGEDAKTMVQEFIVGVRAYVHYFHSFSTPAGYKTSYGKVEMLGIDRRMESNADEIARQLSVGAKIPISFTVMGNQPLVLRESLLPQYMDMGRGVCNSSKELFGGIHGPFCIETIVTEELEVYAFEISARIVAGTNLLESPYSRYSHGPNYTTGMRIAQELKNAAKAGKLGDIVY